MANTTTGASTDSDTDRVADLDFTATDGLPLVGSLHTPASATGPAVIIVHGVGGDRHGAGIVGWARGLVQRGHPVLLINTRGSTWGWSHAGRPYGAGHERLDESPRDIQGAVAAMRAQGHDRVLLAGQSLGTVKIAYTLAQAQGPIAGVAGAVLRSGPLFRTSVMESRYPGIFTETMRRAEAAVASGGPETEIDIEVPLPGRYGAAAYLEKYGPHGRFDWLNNLGRIGVPRLVLMGGADPLPAVQAARDIVAAWTSPPDGVEAHIVPGADHGFSEHADRAADLTADWWRRTAGAPGGR